MPCPFPTLKTILLLSLPKRFFFLVTFIGSQRASGLGRAKV